MKICLNGLSFIMSQSNDCAKGGCLVAQHITLQDLKNTSEISRKCHQSDEPLYVMNDDQCDMVIMSVEAYEKFRPCYEKLQKAEAELAAGQGIDGKTVFEALRARYE